VELRFNFQIRIATENLTRTFQVSRCFNQGASATFQSGNAQTKLHKPMWVRTSSDGSPYGRKLGLRALERKNSGKPSQEAELNDRCGVGGNTAPASVAGCAIIVETLFKVQSFCTRLAEYPVRNRPRFRDRSVTEKFLGGSSGAHDIAKLKRELSRNYGIRQWVCALKFGAPGSYRVLRVPKTAGAQKRNDVCERSVVV
jgi:hypothetical protein